MPKEEAEAFFSEIFAGLHRPSALKPFGLGWSITSDRDLATFDGDTLSRLVFLAHDRAVRVEIQPCNMRFVRIAVHARSRRDGSIFKRHPSLSGAVAEWRQRYPEPAPPEPKREGE